MTLLLSVQDVSKSYDHRPLFTGLSLDLRPGERVGLVGPNGAGKSTLLKLMAGREEPDAGTRSVRRGPFLSNQHVCTGSPRAKLIRHYVEKMFLLACVEL